MALPCNSNNFLRLLGSCKSSNMSSSFWRFWYFTLNGHSLFLQNSCSFFRIPGHSTSSQISGQVSSGARTRSNWIWPSVLSTPTSKMIVFGMATRARSAKVEKCKVSLNVFFFVWLVTPSAFVESQHVLKALVTTTDIESIIVPQILPLWSQKYTLRAENDQPALSFWNTFSMFFHTFPPLQQELPETVRAPIPRDARLVLRHWIHPCPTVRGRCGTCPPPMTFGRFQEP